MKIRTRVFVSIIIATIVLLAGIGVYADEKATIKIGFSLPLTGDLGFIGQGMKKAALMAIEDMGVSDYNFELLFEDDKLDPKIAASVANKYIHVDKVDVTATTSGSTGNVLAKLAEQNGIINFSITVDPGTEAGDFNYSHFTQNEAQNILLSSEIKKRGFKRPASFVNVSLSDYVAIHKDLATRIKLVATGEVQNDQKDFRTEITKVLQANPDIIIFTLRSPVLEMLTRQIREMGYKGRFTSVSAFNATKEMALYEGEFFVGGADHAGWFKDLWKVKFGEDEPTRVSSYAYDVVKLVVFAVENAGVKGKPTARQISDSLNKTHYYPGAVGTVRVLPETGRIWSMPALMLIKDGKITYIKPTT